jgi:hypothetical protein
MNTLVALSTYGFFGFIFIGAASLLRVPCTCSMWESFREQGYSD